MLFADAGVEVKFAASLRHAQQHHRSTRPAKIERPLPRPFLAACIQHQVQPVRFKAARLRCFPFPNSRPASHPSVLPQPGALRPRPPPAPRSHQVQRHLQRQRTHRPRAHNAHAEMRPRRSQPKQVNDIGQRLSEDCLRIAQRIRNFVHLRSRNRNELRKASGQRIHPQKPQTRTEIRLAAAAIRAPPATNHRIDHNALPFRRAAHHFVPQNQRRRSRRLRPRNPEISAPQIPAAATAISTSPAAGCGRG